MKKIILIAFLTISTFSYSQDNEYQDDEVIYMNSLAKKIITEDVINKHYFKISFLLPAIGVEFELKNRFSLDINAKLASAFNFGSAHTQFYPVLHIEPKWNYNINQRKKFGDETKGFSSNFVSLFVSYHVPITPSVNHLLVIGPTWGLQRNFGGFGYFKLNTGLGYFHSFNNYYSFLGLPFINLSVLPIIDIQLGLMF